ncbi:hypothetical protein BgAZ_103850 [Babesia gibsoni]|uniref:OTU domain-containing protein n=1 Tax=Babesia gibsoni TaxID=33632 RepID=A0AAD8UVQ7_BABGI|nr:hypothetical protein BgAZ_103850 [Babesia gibsoni]
MKYSIAVFSFSLLKVVAAKLWYPLDVKDYLCNNIKHGEKLPDDVEPELLLKKLDTSTLSREIAYSVMKNRENYAMPELLSLWEYLAPMSTVERRLRLYGMSIAKHDVRGNGNCLYHSLRTGFIKHGFSVKVLHNFINENLKPSIRAAYDAFKPSGAYYTASELKKLAHISNWGFDPDVKESMDHFDAATFKTQLDDTICQKPHVTVDRGLGTATRYMFDYEKYRDRLNNQEDVKTVASDMFRDMEKFFKIILGDVMDVSALQRIFSFRAVFFNQKESRVTCGIMDDGIKVKFYVNLYFNEGCHFALTGLIDLHIPYQPYEPISIFLAQDLPLPLAIIMGDDCRLSTD